MDVEKIAGFYNDPEKVACEARCLAKAYHLRSLSIDNGLSWRAQRWARFIARLSQGLWRSMTAKQPAHPRHEAPAPIKPMIAELQAPGLIPEPGANQENWSSSGLPRRPSSSQSSSSSSSSSSLSSPA
jgi:hypothetical protein